MIRIKDLTVKNFLSVGNISQSVSFNKQDLVLVLGENLDLGGEDSGSRNGTGKSSILNAISYGLYGQAISNIKKENLINKTNSKTMVVTIDFESNGKEYRIVRGRKPNVLKFYIDDIEQKEEDNDSQGDSRETQQEIQRVLGLSHEMFTQIVALNTYTLPFLSLKVNEQRNIIEELLGITLLSEKAETLKNEIKLTREKIQTEEVHIKSSESANKRIQEQIDTLVRRSSIWNKSKDTDIDELTSAISELSNIDLTLEIQNHQLLKTYNELVTKLQTISENVTREEKSIAKENKNLLAINKDLENLKSQKCHTCNQKISSDIHIELLRNKELQKENIQQIIEQCEKNIADFVIELSDIETKMIKEPIVFYEDINAAYGHKNQLDLLTHQKEQKVNETNPYIDQIISMERNAIVQIDMTNLNTLTKTFEHQEFLVKLLTNKDSFIRKTIIEQNLNYLNSRLNHYTTKMGLPHQVEFLNDLNVNITELGRDLDPGNLSRGETTRLMISLSLSFRDVWENLYQKINLLFIDEQLDSGMDSAGVENALEIFKQMNRTSNRAIWIVSHREELTSRVSNVFKVQKSNGFTEFLQD